MTVMRATTLAALTAAILALGALAAHAGNLTPPGAPAPTMKTLNEVEARTPIKQANLPLTISQPGSYYLVENLTFSTLNANAITITTDGVTIDLNGFTLAGAGKTTGSSGDGIKYSAGGNRCVVMNGGVREFRHYGVYLNDKSIVRDVLATDNGVAGIYIASYGQVINNVCANNGGNGYVYGVCCGSGCVVSNNVCYSNAAGISSGNAYGITTADGCTVTGNICRYTNSYAEGTIAYGISCSGNCIVRGNTCRYNGVGSGTANGAAYGIYAGNDCLVAENLCHTNYGRGTGVAAGIRVYSNSRVEGNHCNNQNGTTSQNYGILLAGSKCVAISNTAENNGSGDMVFYSGTSNGYAGGNLTDTTIVDNGTNTEAGTTPAPNVVF